MKTVKNLVGRRIAQLRNERGWTQEDLSERLQRAGWSLSRSEVSKIEGGSIYVHDFQLYYFAEVFRVPVAVLLPGMDARRPVHETVLRCIRQRDSAPDAILVRPDSHAFSEAANWRGASPPALWPARELG